MPYGISDFTFPAAVRDHDSFRAWARSKDCPEKLRITYLRDTVRIDLAREEFFSHNQVRGELYCTLASIDPKDEFGILVTLGVLLTNVEAEFSTLPDLYYISHETMDWGRVREVPVGIGCMELVGTPDMICEVMSDSTELRDTVELKGLYFKAGVPEYWLIDARGDTPRFDLLHRGIEEYVAVPPLAGSWLKSAVFGRSFRLTRDVDPIGDPLYKLEMK